MGTSYNPRIVTDGLVFCVDAANKRSYPGAGTTWTDLTANKNNGTLTNMDSSNFSNDGAGSLTFDGTDERVSIGTAPNTVINNTGKTTILSWFYATAEGQGMILGNGTTAGRFYIETFGTGGSFVIHYGFGSSQNSTTSNAALVTNRWYHYAASYDGSTANGYLNSILVDSDSIGAQSFAGGINLSYWNASLPLHFTGNIALVQIYNRALTPDEIRQNYLATKGRFQ